MHDARRAASRREIRAKVAVEWPPRPPPGLVVIKKSTDRTPRLTNERLRSTPSRWSPNSAQLWRHPWRNLRCRNGENVPVSIQYSEDGLAWLDGYVWRSRDGRYAWLEKGWEKVPEPLARSAVAKLTAMERVVQGAECEHPSCSAPAFAVFVDENPRPFPVWRALREA